MAIASNDLRGRPLEERARRLEDIEAVRKLKALLCRYLDRGWEGAMAGPAPQIGELFTADAGWSGLWGTWAGREAIERGLAATGITFATNYAINPYIEVDADAARAFWHGLSALTLADGRAVWVAGKYEETYVRGPAGWRISRLIFHKAFVTPYEENWVKGNMSLPRVAGLPT
jgi:hypothetical protein